MPRQSKPPPPRKPNPLRNRPPIVAPTALHRQATAGAAAKAGALPPKRACPNKECSAPDIQDGICHNCGTIVDDSNIVSEVTFGESSSGAAVVQGSYVGADQSTARSLGPAFRRAGGQEDRESTNREGRRIMQGLANQLGIMDPVVNTGAQIFKLASGANFIQGRRMDMVAAVCLYSACRKHRPCRVMLIDFADKVQVNVFKLGHTFKKLHENVSMTADGMQPILPEDLIFRFANKLEFGLLTAKVAEDAVRLVHRMSLDWMVMGRRPSGVCGACLILAARMNNFRRTITEVVYIVKVTTHTIQKRLEEFKLTPSSALSVEDFLNNEFLESAHDPPSFYEKTEDFQKNKKKRKRKRRYGSEDEEEHNSGSEAGSSQRQKTATPAPEQLVQPVELRRDADGFVIPPPPVQPEEPPIDPNLAIDPDLVDEAIADDDFGPAFEKLVETFGEEVTPEEDSDSEENTATSSTAPRKRGPKPNREIHVPELWNSVEDEMANEIDEMISDPHSLYHATSYAKAKRRAAAHMLLAEKINPSKNVNMDVHIGEDEFADDPEVQNCQLSPEDVTKKEQLWVNENKAWLRKEQIKEWQKRLAENGPPKAKRNRKKKARIGEGQTSAASSPGEAAVNVMKARTMSKKVNYEAIHDIFDAIGGLKDKFPRRDTLGSASTSRVTSRAGSELNGSDSRESSMAPSESDRGTPTPSASIPFFRPPKQRLSKAERERAAVTPQHRIIVEDDDEEANPDDYVEPESPAPQAEEDDEEDWRGTMNKAGKGNMDGLDEEGDFPDELDDNVSDYGGIEPGGFEDFDPDAIGGGAADEDDD